MVFYTRNGYHLRRKRQYRNNVRGYLLKGKMTMTSRIRSLVFRVEVMELDKFCQIINFSGSNVHGVMIEQIDHLHQLSKCLPG